MAEQSAEALLNQYFAQFNLPPSLAAWAWTQAQSGRDFNDIILDMRNLPEYKARFPAMEALSKAGRAITEAEYVAYEKGIGTLAQQYGLPATMFSSSYIADMLVAQVSPIEFEKRITINRDAAMNASPETRRAFAEMYGLGAEGALTAYFLDPDVALPEIERRYAAAQVATEAYQQRVGLTREQAERLADDNVTRPEAQRAFAQVAATRGLEAAVGEVITERERVDAAFGDAAAAEKQRRVQSSRAGQYQGGGSFAATAEGVSGLG
jgi:hypothetical protein